MLVTQTLQRLNATFADSERKMPVLLARYLFWKPVFFPAYLL